MSQTVEAATVDMIDALRWHEEDRAGDRLAEKLRTAIAEKACDLLGSWYQSIKSDGPNSLKDICRFVCIEYSEDVKCAEIQHAIRRAEINTICTILMIIQFREKMPEPEMVIPGFLLPTYVRNHL